MSRLIDADELKDWLEIVPLTGDGGVDINDLVEHIDSMPTAQPTLEEFEWCTDCKEYDQKAHCCHRFGKVIRQTVEELKVVRCKDCTHDDACEVQNAAHTGEWFYCGYGERGEKNG